MTYDSSETTSGTLREKAEERFSRKGGDGVSDETTDLSHLIHELKIHQIELEMQNEGLTAAHLKAEDLRQEYQTLFDAAPVGYLLLEANSTIVRINRQAERLFSIRENEVMGKRLAVFLDETSLPVFQTFLADCFQKSDPQSCEIPYQAGHVSLSTTRYLHLNGRMIRNHGEQNHCLVAVIDISKRKAMEQALAEGEYRYRELFHNVSEAIFLHELTSDPTGGRFLEVNDVACQRLGYTREELLQLRVGDITTAATRKDDPARVEKLQRTRHLSFQGEQVRKDGTVFPVEVKVRVINIHNQQYLLSLVRDLTEEQENTRREAMAIRQIEENLMQLAILNDEIRNPLTVIVAMLDEVRDEKKDIILQQIEKINDIVTKLDQKWLESAKSRDYLHRIRKTQGSHDDPVLTA